MGLYQFVNRTENGAGPLLDSENAEELAHVIHCVSVAFGNRSPESPGTLYISTRRVIWLSDEDWEKGYAVDFLSISLHAVCRDPEAYSSPCIYTQIEIEEDEDEDEDDTEESYSEPFQQNDLSKVKELRLIPSSPEQLDKIFQVFCECAEMNPEPVEEDEQDDNNWVFSADQISEDNGDEDSQWLISQNQTLSIGTSNGEHELARNVLELQLNDQRFEDADEMDESFNAAHFK